MDSQKQSLGVEEPDLDLTSQKHLLGTGGSSQELFSDSFLEKYLPFSDSQEELFSVIETASELVANDVMMGTGVSLSGLSQPNYNYSRQSHVEHQNIPETELGNNSFNLSQMGDEMKELSQNNTEDFDVASTQLQFQNYGSSLHANTAVSVVGSATPPSSGDFMTLSHGNALDYPTATGTNIKSEGNVMYGYNYHNQNGNNANTQCRRHSLQENEYPPDSDACANDGLNDILNCSGTNSSQDESQGDRIPILNDYEGPLHFSVEATEKTSSKKCIFSSELNKIYCVDRFPISFNIGLDFAMAKDIMKDLTLRTVVYYSSNSIRLRSLEQCSNCRALDLEPVKKESKKKGLKENSETVEKKKAPAVKPNDYDGHVVRAVNSKFATYVKKRGNHNCVNVPLERPQAGADKIIRNYSFMCMNSCKKQGKEQKKWALVFYLMKGEKELGRACFDLKVCKCPSRDANHDEAKLKEVQLRLKKSHTASPRKTEASVKLEDLEFELHHRSPKQPRFSKEYQERGRGSAGAIAGTSTGFSGGKGTPRANSQLETDSESFSQEDSQNGSFLTKVTEQIKLVIAHRRHPNPTNREYIGVTFKTLNTFQKQTEFYQNHFATEADEEVEDPKPGNDENKEGADGEGSQAN